MRNSCLVLSPNSSAFSLHSFGIVTVILIHRLQVVTPSILIFWTKLPLSSRGFPLSPRDRAIGQESNRPVRAIAGPSQYLADFT